MKLAVLGRLVAAALIIALPAAAQPYGPQPDDQPFPSLSFPPQQVPSRPGPGQGFPSQGVPPRSAPSQPYGPPNGGPSLVGTWSGQSNGPNGLIQAADAFGPDGRFVSMIRMPNGFLARGWGMYRATPVSSYQLRLELRVQGWLPREICQQLAGGQPQCQPMQMPSTDTSLVTFSSPNQFQSISETTTGNTLFESRDDQPALLQAQAPQRWITVVQPSYTPSPGPIVTPYPGRSGPATNIPGLGGNCDDLQQRRICNINDGQLIRGRDGCLRCDR